MRTIFSGTRYSVVASTLALILALGGTAYAAATIRGADIVDNTVTTQDLRNGTVTPLDMAPSALPRFARVAGGSIVARRGAITVSSGGTGVYNFSFGRSIVNCGYTATVQSSFADTAVVGNVQPAALTVYTYDTQTNGAITSPFTLVVTC